MKWTWVWVGAGSWWWTRKPGVLQSMGLQRVGHDWVTELSSVHWALKAIQEEIFISQCLQPLRVPFSVRLHIYVSSTESHHLHKGIHAWVCLPAHLEDRAFALIIHQAGEGSESKLLGHDTAEVLHSPVSAWVDGGWGRGSGNCFLIKTNTMGWCRQMEGHWYATFQLKSLWSLCSFFCWRFPNFHSEFCSSLPLFLASTGIAHTEVDNGSFSTIIQALQNDHECHNGDENDESNHNITKLQFLKLKYSWFPVLC